MTRARLESFFQGNCNKKLSHSQERVLMLNSKTFVK